MPSYPGARGHLLDSQRVCERKEDFKVHKKDKKQAWKPLHLNLQEIFQNED